MWNAIKWHTMQLASGSTKLRHYWLDVSENRASCGQRIGEFKENMPRARELQEWGAKSSI